MHEGRRCSFCGKTKEQARLLIASAGSTFICDVCVGLCAEIVAEQLPFDGKWGAACRGEEGRASILARVRCRVKMSVAHSQVERAKQEAKRAEREALLGHAETAADDNNTARGAGESE